ALDVAASQIVVGGKYRLNIEERSLDSAQWMQQLIAWSDSYPIVSIEDPFGEDDWSAWSGLTRQIGHRVQIVGDDLFATSTSRLRRGIATRAATTVLVKP